MNKFIQLAYFPEIKHPLREFCAAPVVLQTGNQNWGIVHIEHYHSKEFKGQSVEVFVAEIVKAGISIFSEFEGVGKNQKALVVNSRKGTAVLAYKQTLEGNFYTVISAFARKRSMGELIGRLE